MPKNDIISFANTFPVAYMATVEGTEPRVHAFDMWKADDSGFYFHNNASVGVYDQIANNPNVELLFRSPDGKRGLRVVGKAEPLGDPAIAAAYYASSPARGAFAAKGKSKMTGKPAMFRVIGTAWLRQQDKGKHNKDVGPVDQAVFP